MICTDGIGSSVMDFTALDEELFGSMSGNEGDDRPEQALHNHDNGPTICPHSSISHFDKDEVAPQLTPQASAASQSGHYTPPLSLPTTPVSPRANQQHSAPDSGFLDLKGFPSATLASSEEPSRIVIENISWVKNRITDVHQLLLHYLNLRDAHQSMATDLQKEMVLQAESKVALESIREQQDQTSEDFPRLQFQIAQLKLDCQKERAARAAAEANIVSLNEKIKAYASAYTMMRTWVFDFEMREKTWQKEKEELASLLETPMEGVGSIRPQNLSLGQSSPEILEGGTMEGIPPTPGLVSGRPKEKEIQQLN